jgi:hypothetical protein
MITGRDHLGDFDINGKEILKYILEIWIEKL